MKYKTAIVAILVCLGLAGEMVFAQELIIYPRPWIVRHCCC